jgi:hypothetical protein
MVKILGDVRNILAEQGHSIDLDVISARIRWLADIGRIEGFGDLRQWRYSEIALKD